MNYKIPGLSSITFMFIALVIASFQLFTVSIITGTIYIILIPVVFLNLLYWYCRKCPHSANGTCRHVIFGWITKKVFSIVAPTKYTVIEIIFSLAPLAVLILLPQYLLFKNLILFIAFWILMLIAGVIVRTGVCPGCRNLNCAFCPNK
jgi:hypothetical protein